MRKKTAKILGAVLIVIYLIFISGGVLWWLSNRKDHSSQTTLSEDSSSDNVSYGENETVNNVEEQETQNQLEQSDERSEAVDGTYGDESMDETSDSLNDDKENQVSTNDNDTIRMIFTGDVYIGNYVGSIYDSQGILGVVSEKILNQFQTADITMVNQEFPFSTRGEPMKDKQYTFRVDPQKIQMFSELGIDVVSLANNHTLDYGIDAMVDSMDTLTNAGITYVGAGSNLSEAKQTKYHEVNGKKIAFLGASRVIPVSEWSATSNKAGLFTTYDPTALIQEVKIAKEEADFVIVYLHWGLEHKEYPEDYERTMGKQLIDAGADLVLGSHPHVLQGFEYYNGKLIAYSLGNFIFSQTINQTAYLSVDITKEGKISVQVIPCKTMNGNTFELEQENEIKNMYNYLSNISYYAHIDEDGIVIEQ